MKLRGRGHHVGSHAMTHVGKTYPRSIRDTLLDQTSLRAARRLYEAYSTDAKVKASRGTRRKWARAIAALEARIA